jgi:uncharacterized membrane protein
MATTDEQVEIMIDESKKPSKLDNFLSYAIPATGTAKGGFFTTVLGIVYHMRILFQVSKLHYFLLPIAPVAEFLELLWDSIVLYKAPKKTPENIASVIFNTFKFFAVTAAVVLILGFAIKLGAIAGLTGGIIFTAITGAGAVINTIFAITKGIRAYHRNREADAKINASRVPGMYQKQLINEANDLRQQAQNLKTEVRYHIYGAVLMTIMTPLIALVFIKGIFGAAIAGSAVAGVGTVIGVGMFIYDKFIKKPAPTVTPEAVNTESKANGDKPEHEPTEENDLDPLLGKRPDNINTGAAQSAPASNPSVSTPTGGKKDGGSTENVAINNGQDVEQIKVVAKSSKQSVASASSTTPVIKPITVEFLSKVLRNITSKSAATDAEKKYQNARLERRPVNASLNNSEAETHRLSTPTISV